MRKLSYRSRLRLRRILKRAALVLVILIALAVCTLVYLQRYVVYTTDGAHLDFSRSNESIETAEPDAAESELPIPEQVEITYAEQDETTAKLKQINGYYITCEMLRTQPEQVMEALRSIDNSNAIMLDLKDNSGTFYYSTHIAGASTGTANTAVVDELISYLNRNGYTMIARIPAFADSDFAAAHNDYALAIEGGALWTDETGNYWLDPEKPTVLSYLEQICKELSSLGFHEVVFNDFMFPTSGAIVYTGSLTRAELIASAAKEIENAFRGSNLIISFCTTDTAFPVDADAGRIYVPNASGANVDKLIGSMTGTVADPQTQVVFLSNSRDTRFDSYGTLRPLLTTTQASIDLPE